MQIVFKPRRAGGIPVTYRVHGLVRAADRARDARDWPAAAEAYRVALDADSTLIHLWAQLGHALKESGQPAAAIEAYRRALLHMPADGEIHVFLGEIYYGLNELDAALAEYRAALVQLPDRPGLAETIRALEPLPNRSADEILLLQTCDPIVYPPMLELSARTALPYAVRHGLRYQSFTGLKRGHLPWHATFNRIDLLNELIARDYRGWVLYMDADTWIVDEGFALRAYLADKTRYALIGAPAGDSVDHLWNFNIGVMLYNLGHPFMRHIVFRWAALLARIDFDKDVPLWSTDTVEDQALFHHILQSEPEADVAAAVLHVEKAFMNSPDARFIRQAMRSLHNSFAGRLAVMQRSIAGMGR